MEWAKGLLPWIIWVSEKGAFYQGTFCLPIGKSIFKACSTVLH
jgi:hypothetical protein